MKKLYFSLIAICGISLNAQIIDIPDANFKAKLLSASAVNNVAKNLNNEFIKVDANYNGEIEMAEALEVRELQISVSNITSIEGIQHFANLVKVVCEFNNLTNIDVISGMINLQMILAPHNQITSLNLTELPNLLTLEVFDNQITMLNISSLTNLTWLHLDTNPINELDLTGLTNLNHLSCCFNNLTELDLTPVPDLTELYCMNNQLTTLDVNVAPNLVWLNFESNLIASIDVSGLPELKFLIANNNLLTTLDAGHNPKLVYLLCKNNPLLTSIFMKNGSNESDIFIQDNPNLHYICADESQFLQIQDLILQNNYTNCILNSYCSFSPGGSEYEIAVRVMYDSENDGCDATDQIFPPINFNFSGEITSENLFGALSSPLAIFTPAGTFSINPLFENNYFNISPSLASISFPLEASPFTQDFCITAVGIHPNLEVVIIPLSSARSGFDADYKLIYKNNGNQIQSGSIDLSFNDAVSDYVSSDPTIASQLPDSLSWDFSGLLPFETRIIYFSLNLNSPLESPALNGGDILHYTATINSSQTDETPLDNTFTLNQTVVNSFDPNDKTCLEGNTITPEMVGNYVHYIIRFENTGTANAQNIVVKDMIDTTKFDISSLIPLDGSHSFTTRISDTNKVEFIFENIQLPFDDANNDGYVAFKIKTKPTLVVGNAFSNTASIYFDYNAPIMTNTATTAIQVLGTDDFDFNARFTLFPNPVNDILNIKSSGNEVINSLSVYNTLGQLLMKVSNPTESIDVSTLTTGNYIVKIGSDKGSTSSKFIKN